MTPQRIAIAAVFFYVTICLVLQGIRLAHVERRLENIENHLRK